MLTKNKPIYKTEVTYRILTGNNRNIRQFTVLIFLETNKPHGGSSINLDRLKYERYNRVQRPLYENL